MSDEMNQRIDAALNASRPDRYEPGDSWINDVIADIAGEINMFEARQIAAEVIVRRREAEATKRVNRLLKQVGGPGGQYALPFDWYAYISEPVAFERTDARGGMRRIRVALRAMTADDWRNFALNGRVAAQHRHDAEMAMYDSAEWLAAEQGDAMFGQWATVASPQGHEGIA